MSLLQAGLSRRSPDPPPAQPGPRVLRQEAGRGQDAERGPALAEAAGQQRHLRLPAGRCPAGRSPCQGPGRAAGERLCRQRGRLAPQAPALRTSHSRTRSPPYDRGQQPSAWPCPWPGHSWPFPGRCHPAAGDAAGPGGAPAAQRGRTTWRCAKTTATPGREEGQGQRIADHATAPEGHLTPREKDRWKSLTQRGFRSARLAAGRIDPPVAPRSFRSGWASVHAPCRVVQVGCSGAHFGSVRGACW